MSVLQHLRLTSRLGKFLFIFILISFSSPSHQPCCGWVCVWTICIDIRLPFFAGGHRFPRGSVANEDTLWVPVQTYLLLYIFHVVPPLGAFKSQLGGRLVYRCWFILSMSSVVIYILVHLIVSICFVGVFARLLHSTPQVDKTSEQVGVVYVMYVLYVMYVM